MTQTSLSAIITDQTYRALWEVKSVVDSVPDNCWNKEYCQMPLWKHIYHMLHSLDLWLINPRDPDYRDPAIHVKDLNNLDVITNKHLSREEINAYLSDTIKKITKYVENLQDKDLLEMPPECEYTKFTLIMAQNRHLHTHMGMIMGFIVAETGFWPPVIGLEGKLAK